jgi:uncharacterized protein
MLKLTQINVFPIKSLDGYSPESAIVEQRGLQHDRRWLITDKEGMFMTQRTNGRMALLRASVTRDFLIIEEKQNPDNCIKIEMDVAMGFKKQSPIAALFYGKEPLTDPSKFVQVCVWNDTMDAIVVSDAANQFLSDFLQTPCQLVVMPDTTRREIDPDWNTGDDIVSFADGYPFLIIGEATMRDLNERLDTPLSIRRFRTNFIFSGGTPFEEDGFKNFRIGEVDFIGIKPCARCVLTTRDPDTGTKGKEPLQTLQTYRQTGTKILFGENIVWNSRTWRGGFYPTVCVGDDIVKLDN